MAKLSKFIGTDGARIQAPQHICLYGPPKAGKTQLIGELANEGFTLIYFDLENGKSTLLKEGLLTPEALERITYIGVKDTKDAPLALVTLDKIIRGGNFNICDEHGRVDCPNCKASSAEFTIINIPTKFTEEAENTIVIIDSFTQLSMSVINTVIAGKSIDYQETLHDFRNQGNYLNRVFSYLQQAPFHCIGTAHEIEAEREDGSMRIVPSIGSRNYAITAGKFFDHIVYMDKTNGKHKGYSSTGYSNVVLTGSRLGVEIEKLDRPNLAAIIRGEVVKSGGSSGVSGASEQAKATLGGLGKKLTLGGK